MESLYQREVYGADLAHKIEQLGSMAVSVTNRWMLGWPRSVKTMLGEGTFFDLLVAQVEQEASVLAEEANLRHLSRTEILHLYEIRESPPC